jgi:hypothetical protein
MKHGMVFGKAMIMLMVAVMVMGGISSLAWARNQALFDKGINMMVDAKNVLSDAIDTIDKGQKMYQQIAQEKGFANEVAPGSQKIDEGQSEAHQGVALIMQGQKEYEIAKGKSPKAAKEAAKKMIEGGRMVQEALNGIQEGVKMNNDVLRAKNLASEVEAPTKTILKGTESGLTGTKQFVQGQKLVMDNM